MGDKQHSSEAENASAEMFPKADAEQVKKSSDYFGFILLQHFWQWFLGRSKGVF